MKSIAVSFTEENIFSVKIYSSGNVRRQNENGEWEEVIQTEDEMEQQCYHSLIEDIRRQEFDKVIKNIISDYLKYEKNDLKD